MSFNLGEPGDLRVPDAGWSAPRTEVALHVPTAVAVLGVLSPADETFAKLDFDAARGVREVLVADPATRTVSCRVLAGEAGPWRQADDSEVFAVSMTWLAEQIRWS